MKKWKLENRKVTNIKTKIVPSKYTQLEENKEYAQNKIAN